MSEQIPVKQIPPANPKKPDDGRQAERFNPGKRIYVRAVKGLYQRLRRNMGWLMMLAFLGLPWVPYEGRQGILLDLANQKFYLFGVTLWPQDLTLLAYLLMFSAFALFFMTTFLGRVWCGYMCPQTVWTFLFIWFEEKFEGNANQRKKLDSAPMSANKLWRKAAKHSGWLLVSLVTALTFVGYFVPINGLVLDFFTGQAGFWLTFWVLFFAFCTYGNAGWMREIMCTHMCPYARFQSAMFDKDTFIVGYDASRGEQRGPRSRKQDPKTLGLGDCIDCKLCVQVCPTGIDIRDGLQYECINCGACIDACDEVMVKMGYQPKLISYTTEHQLAGGKTHVLRPKLLGYGLVMIIMTGLLLVTFANRTLAQLDVVRDRSALYRESAEGLIVNEYTLKVLNKDVKAHEFVVTVKGIDPTALHWSGNHKIMVASGEVATLPVSLSVDPYDLKGTITDIEFSAKAADNADINAEHGSRFFGPQ